MDTTETKRPECRPDALSAPVPAVVLPPDSAYRLTFLERCLGFLLFSLPWIAAGLACLPALYFAGLGLYRLVFGGLRLTFGAFLLFFLFPGLNIFLVLRMLRKDLPISSKVLRTLGLWILLGAALLFGVLLTARFPLEYHEVVRENAAEAFAAKYHKASAFNEPEVGTPISVEYHKIRQYDLIGQNRVSILLCRYTEEDYPRDKAAAESGLTFREKELLSDYSPLRDEYETYEPTVRIGDDVFRFVEPDSDWSWEPFYNFCDILVTNDVTHEIAWLTYYDVEVDSIQGIEYFLEYPCGWHIVR